MKLFVESTLTDCKEKDSILNDVQNFLKIEAISAVRKIALYHINGLNPKQIEDVACFVFSQKDGDTVTKEIDLSDCTYSFGYRLLDHQYDQQADACEKLLKAYYPKESPRVKVVRFLGFKGEVVGKEELLESYFVNPLVEKMTTEDGDMGWNYGMEEPRKVETIKGFTAFNAEELASCAENYGVSMSKADLLFSQDYFKEEGRDPTVTELKILDTYWSDHCRHSTFLTELTVSKEEGNPYAALLKSAEDQYQKDAEMVYGRKRPLCLMDMATMQMKKMKKAGSLTNLEESDEVNACSIEVTGKVDGKDEEFLLMFKNETHNHPTEMEPYGGAGTCIGGGIRDPLSGRAYVFGAMRITGSGNPLEPYDQTMKNKLPQRVITTTAANGYSDYGNQIGLASGYLQEYYDDGFKAKRMECGALVAYNYKKNIVRENAKNGQCIIMMGGKTGRDGVGGATGSSNEQKKNTVEYAAEVQKGNPEAQKGIIRLFRKPEFSRMIKKSNDFGAGGVSVAIGEMADSLHINLDAVPLKYQGMDGTEVAISESQERMAVLVDAKDADKFIAEAEKENVDAIVVAKITDNQRIVMDYKGQKVCDLKSSFLNSGGVRQKAEVLVVPPNFKEKEDVPVATLWEQAFCKLNNCSKKGIANQFDKTVGGQTVLMPFGGRYQATPEQGLGMVLPLEKGETNLGVLMTVGYDPQAGYESPFHMAYYGVVESIMKIVSMGGKKEDVRLTFQEYFERMNSKESWGKAYSALLGAFLAQSQLNVPSVGGKDSMSGSYGELNVPPSLLSFAVAPCDVTSIVSRSFKEVGSNVYLLSTAIDELGVPNGAELLANIEQLTRWIDQGKISASSVVGAGGIPVSIGEMCFGNNIGFLFDRKVVAEDFAKNHVDVIIETKEELPLLLLGKTISDKRITDGAVTFDLADLQNKWEGTLSGLFPTATKNANYAPEPRKEQRITEEFGKRNEGKTALVPLFPGTTGEYTLVKELEKAGIPTNVFVINTKELESSIKQLSNELDKSNLLVLPAGMTNGGEPHHMGQFAECVINNPTMAEAINRHLDNGGLIFGLGEGFSALIHTGLIQHGRVGGKTDSVVVARNSLGKHYSALVETQIVCPVSPWVSDTLVDEILPLSAKDGQIMMSPADFEKYLNNGQIVSQYCESNHPLIGSHGIEALCSPNGQVFGRMADITALAKGLYANVFSASSHELFMQLATDKRSDKE